MQKRFIDLKNLEEETKDENEEKDHFLNQDETIVEIIGDGDCIFRCLAHQIL